MPKYYIKCGTLELKYSTDKTPLDAAIYGLNQTNKFDILDEYFYVDERGIRDYISADKNTQVISLKKVAKKAGWILNKNTDTDCEGK